MFKFNIRKLLFFIIGILGFAMIYANYNSRVKEVDQLIDKNMKGIKSTEKLDIPEYKGDTLTFQRLSKIRNVFNVDHLLPFEKRKQMIPKNQPKKKVVKLKPIVIPPELQEMMDMKPTKLQQYPVDSFTFKGVVYQNNDKWGVVENSREFKPIYLREGEAIGQNYGKIEDISKEGILVGEWKKNQQKRVWEKIQTVIH